MYTKVSKKDNTILQLELETETFLKWIHSQLFAVLDLTNEQIIVWKKMCKKIGLILVLFVHISMYKKYKK